MERVKTYLFLLMASLLAFACEDKVKNEITMIANVPVYMSREEFKSAVKKTIRQEMKEPGKIYIKDNYLFVNEINKGIHVINNANPSAPDYICFINIPGNVDLAIKANTLYADSYIDLVAIDILDPRNPKEIGRVENAFPNIYPKFDQNYPLAPIDPDKGIVIGFTVDEVTIEQERQPAFYSWRFSSKDMAGFSGSESRGGIGIAGSMARFAISNDVLYAINNGFELKIFEISNNKIQKRDSISTFWNIETLFIYDKKLFIGSFNGMFIYDIRNPHKPVYVSQYNHVTSCDPVVVSGEYAFVTLRSGTNCRNAINELNVVSIKNIQKPVLEKAYPMFNPHGLGIDNGILFICDGGDGLKVYDATDVTKIDQNMVAHFKDINTYDVIPFNKILIMTGPDGIFQYDYSNIKEIKKISHIPIIKNQK
jgi:hypothetical protein